ncbi:Putative proline-specific permease put4 [Fusarium odoratissimum]|uniref:Putative proline-specific permease put4 n=1 Tax=Fusarium oxysporum f. sp. cubense (strain race 4) TaxID=2502994 RepID=N1S1A6_FUSC4|nr:Putative proline-specific permease put4 [Fusarium odoratissimum]
MTTDINIEKGEKNEGCHSETEHPPTQGELLHRHGELNRGLKSRHIQFIAIGGSIGTGLFLGIGSALTKAGPLSLLLGYTITGIFIFVMMMSLGEMATWLPLPGALPQFCARYVDGALGFAVGWNVWYSAAITLCAELSAASLIIGYWKGAEGVNVAVWITIILVVVVLLNIFAVSIYGEAEFCFASIKVITIVGLLIMTFIVMLGGNPQGRRLGFTYWKNPGPMKEYLAEGDLGRFLGFFTTLINAAFSFGGVEMVAVAAGEAENPRKNIPKAVRRIFWRIIFFYVLGALAVGILVASNDPRLLSAQASGTSNAAASPWVIGVQNVGISVLPSIINAVILSSASSSANAFIYTFFLKCNKQGVHWIAVLVTSAMGLLTYLSVQKDGGAAQAFQWFQNLVTISSLFTWSCAAWAALIYFSMLIIFNGFSVFMSGRWNISDFFAAYVNTLIFAVLFIAWKLIKKTKWIPSNEADITSGKDAIDALEEIWEDPKPRNALECFWIWLA